MSPFIPGIPDIPSFPGAPLKLLSNPKKREITVKARIALLSFGAGKSGRSVDSWRSWSSQITDTGVQILHVLKIYEYMDNCRHKNTITMALLRILFFPRVRFIITFFVLEDPYNGDRRMTEQ